ncbi:hypothetical protein Zmor_004456 [Zophobas morio]|uniref:Uncharacterized protein n=1 Tax=Zophobas morio TaxID=2755281 RepID=A0AA38HI77_9CUCU|nr:hypothetical protein Zmor_004456 [Zophobas morio]
MKSLAAAICRDEAMCATKHVGKEATFGGWKGTCDPGFAGGDNDLPYWLSFNVNKMFLVAANFIDVHVVESPWKDDECSAGRVRGECGQVFLGRGGLYSCAKRRYSGDADVYSSQKSFERFLSKYLKVVHT